MIEECAIIDKLTIVDDYNGIPHIHNDTCFRDNNIVSYKEMSAFIGLLILLSSVLIYPFEYLKMCVLCVKLKCFK